MAGYKKLDAMIETVQEERSGKADNVKQNARVSDD